MTERKYPPFDNVVGVIVKGDPEERMTPTGKRVMTFTVLKALSFEDNDIEYVDAEVWNVDLIEALKGQLYKGSQVALVGQRKPSEKYNDKFSAFRVGTVSFVKKAQAESRDF